jgi:alpha-D-ribose 1-methylphosphonate 5-triphosphate synthase subunit PhnH
MASIVLITEPFSMPRLEQFRFGDEDGPENSSLLVIQVEGFSTRDSRAHCPANSPRRTYFTPAGLPEYFWTDWKAQCRSYPIGINVLLTWQDVLVAMMWRP